MNENELLDALREARAGQTGAEGFTMAELVRLLNASPRNPRPVREAMRELIMAGKAESVKVVRTRMDGQSQQVAGYRLKA